MIKYYKMKVGIASSPVFLFYFCLAVAPPYEYNCFMNFWDWL